MKRCLKCRRFGVEYDPSIHKERCLWNNCLWVNSEDIDLDNYDYGINFREFRDAIRLKESMSA